MKQMTIALAALSIVAGAAYAGPNHTTGKKAHATAAKNTAPIICPVTGTKIASAAKAYAKETYKGKTYYFCCPECKPRFDKNRDGIIKNAKKGKYEAM